MQAQETSLLNFMKDVHQVYVPIFQRNYNWSINECNQLLTDILKVGSLKEVKSHFIGSVVFIKDDPFVSSFISHIMLIDGQQRITTITLLISALTMYLKENPISSEELKFDNLLYYYLINNPSPEKDKYKLLLNDKDKNTLIKIIDSIIADDVLSFNDEDSLNIVNNFNYFMNNINTENIKTVFNGLNRLNIIQIALNQNIDNPQLIYESLNSTGLELSNADLIRNYVLMTFPSIDQETIYNKYWQSMEKGYEGTNLFDRFIRDYLTINLNHIPTFHNVYKEFKDYSFNWEMEDLLKDINKHSKYYLTVALGKDADPEISKAFKHFNQLKAQVAYPFLLEVYEDYVENKISKDILFEVLSIVESYIFRRSICGIPTPSLNKTFASLYKSINKENYIESLSASLLLLDSYKRYPSDEEFKENLLTQDVYKNNNIFYLLSTIEENYHPRITLNLDKCSVEHIMPQNPKISKEWQKSLGVNYQEIHDKYLHTLGNLTLTEYNPELSDNSFEFKKNIPTYGFNESVLSLNKCIRKQEDWNKDKIFKRAENLADLAINIWKYPIVSKEILTDCGQREPELPEDPFDSYSYIDLQHNLFDTLEEKILNLGKDVRRNLTQSYIAFKSNINFVYIYPQRDGLQLELLMPIGILKDPENKVNVKSKVHYNDKVSHLYKIYSTTDIDYAMGLIKQVYDYSKTKPSYQLNGVYTLDSYEYLHYNRGLFDSLNERILNLGGEVERKLNKYFIVYKTYKNFVDINPNKGFLRITIYIPFEKVDDPKEIGEKGSVIGNGVNRDFFFRVSSFTDLDYAMNLIKQAYDYTFKK